MTAPCSVSFPALGSTALLVVTEPEALVPAHLELGRQLDELDRACSRFRPDSELRRLDEAGGEPMPASELLLDAVDAALRAARLTDGRVTPTLGKALDAAGYDRTFAQLAPRLDGPRFLSAPDWRDVVVDRAAGTLSVPLGVTLDLGATAKAFAADRAVGAIAARVGGGVLVALGGDIAVAGETPPGGWRVWADDVHDVLTTGAAHIRLHEGGLATSSITARTWRRGTERLHHILEPDTGRPAAGPWRTVSVAAAWCLDANIASTGAVLIGDDAPAWLDVNRLPARLVRHDGRVTRVADWPEEAAAVAA